MKPSNGDRKTFVLKENTAKTFLPALCLLTLPAFFHFLALNRPTTHLFGFVHLTPLATLCPIPPDLPGKQQQLCKKPCSFGFLYLNKAGLNL
jgi:hypothetical protein